MIINKKSNLPAKQNNRNTSMYVFIYYTNNSRFCLGYYDFDSKLWVDGDGMVITNDFLWCYLPVKQMKLFIQNMCNGNLFTRKFNIDGTEYKMFNLEIMGNRVNVATHGLHEKIEEMIGADRYDEVRYIDNLYGYFLPSDVESMRDISNFLTTACENKELHCLAITGNDDFYDVTRVGDYDDIGESLYFAITRDRKLFDMVSQTVRIAAEILDVE